MECAASSSCQPSTSSCNKIKLPPHLHRIFCDYAFPSKAQTSMSNKRHLSLHRVLFIALPAIAASLCCSLCRQAEIQHHIRCRQAPVWCLLSPLRSSGTC